MYNTVEKFDDDGLELGEVLKSCIKNYFRIIIKEKDLQFVNDNNIINMVSKEILSNMKGVKNVL